MTALMPCPMCGGEVLVASRGKYWDAYCHNCRLWMWADTEKQLKETWNRRINDGGDHG